MKPLIVGATVAVATALLLATAAQAESQRDGPGLAKDPPKESPLRGMSDPAEDALQHEAPLGDGEEPDPGSDPDHEPPEPHEPGDVASDEPEAPAENPTDPEDVGIDWGWDE